MFLIKKNGRHLPEIRELNKLIRNHFVEKRKLNVRCAANGTKGNIWRAVGIAKDLNPDTIPANMTLGGVKVDPFNVAGAFAKHFADKIKSNISTARVNANGVYNGKCKMLVQNELYTTNDTTNQKGMSLCRMRQL